MDGRKYAPMSSRPALKTENFDMESFFDFNQGGTQPSPINPSSARPDATPQTAAQDWNSLSPFDQPEERQHFNGPSHDYTQYKQQVGLPLGSIQSMPMQPQIIDGFNSGIDMNMDAGFGSGWSTGIDMDADMGMDFNQPPQAAMPPPVFFSNDGPSANFVNPNTLAGQEEAGPSNVGRLWPGMHSQQAQAIAMQKAAQTQAMQQRQMKLQAQQQQYRQAANAAQSQSQGSSAQQQSHGNGKRPSHATEPHVEESISRLLNQMRHNSSVSDDAGSPDNLLPQIARMRKDEEEMDEDERLLASEEGKKLSSKERRQLRNKVSARAFRSRRKEYIGQLEGEIALKTQDANNLRSENARILQENERYRGLIETLLRHPAFTPFINDISANPSALDINQLQQKGAQTAPAPQQQPPQPQQQQQAPAQQQHQATQEDVKPEFMNFDASQLQIPQQQQQQQSQQQQGNERVGMAMIPENDFSKLNINGLQQPMNFNYQSVNAFPVTDLPLGPDPADLLAANCSASASTSYSTGSSDLNLLLARLDNSAMRTVS